MYLPRFASADSRGGCRYGQIIWGRRPIQARFWLALVCFDVEYTVEWIPHMQIVQIVLDKKLLHAADQAAKRTKKNRSALVRDALREHLRRLELRANEERDRQGYSRPSQTDAEAQRWESEAIWPQE
jgi:hypothetical protein